MTTAAAPPNPIPSASSSVLLPANVPTASNGILRRFSEDHPALGLTSVHTTPRTLRKGKQRSYDDLRLLAVSAQITEIFYSLSDLQTRIFEIQELRHRSLEPSSSKTTTDERTSSESTRSSTSVIDNALGQLDVRLDVVAQSVASVTTTLEPVLNNMKTPTDNQDTRARDAEEEAVITRKYGDLLREWDSVKGDATTLREELKEDKWLAVFRTVSEQAEGMMGSLTKAVNMCQDFVHQVHQMHQRSRRSHDGRPDSLYGEERERSQPSLGACEDLIKSFEAKKKYYMPSTTKVIQVLSKGINDRVTKNGECLRKYADMKTRWDALKAKIERVDADMEKVRKILVNLEKEPSERGEDAESEASMSLGASPGDRASWAPSNSSASGSTFARLAQKVSSAVGRSTPNLKQSLARLDVPDSNPRQQTISRRSSFFPFRSAQPGQETFKEIKGRPKLFQNTSSYTSVTPSLADDWIDVKGTIKPTKPRWNISTKPSTDDSPPLPPVPAWAKPSPTLSRSTPPRPPSSTSRYGSYTRPPTVQPPPLPARSSSRPYTPHRLVSNGSSTKVSPPSRPASRAQSAFGMNATPRARPKTPSLIPTPRIFSSNVSQMSDDGYEGPTTPWMARAFTPSPSISPSVAGLTPHRRRPSGSHIPVPSFGPRSRAPSPAMSSITRPGSPSNSSMLMSSAMASLQHRSQTPDHSPQSITRLRHHASSSTGNILTPNRQNGNLSAGRGPPSSFREASVSSTPSRPSSRSGSHTPAHAQESPNQIEPPRAPLYLPMSVHDPLDNEVARVVNSVPHGMAIQRVDPPLRSAPRPGEEVKAQYVVSNALGQRTLAFRLVTIQRGAGSTSKVMCRVGGGWMDLSAYLQNRYSV